MKNIIFDWSGVVRDTASSQMWLVNYIFKKYGVVEISIEEFRENWRQPPALFYQKYLPKNYNETERSKLFQKLQLEKECPKATSFSEVVNLIHRCKEKGYFLAVVSSDFSETLLPEVKDYGLENTFNEIITNANNKLEPTKELLEKYNLQPEETYFIGDSDHEIEVSRKLGLKSIATTWGFCTEERLRAYSPDYVVHNTKELDNILL